MTDAELRTKIQSQGGWYAVSKNDGPAHIMTDSKTFGLCGAMVNTRKIAHAKNLCKNCRKIAEGMMR